MDIYTFGELLTTFRKQRRISQNELAEKLDVHRNTIGKWERGIGLPESKTIVLELAKQLRLNQQETRQLLEASLTAVSPYWNVPYQRNPFFTGRKEILHHLHTVLLSEKTAALTQSHALSGLGGIGKTQIAIEYAYQHAPEYAAIFWIGADTYETLTASFLSIAEILNLSEKGEQDQSKVIAAVIRWFSSHSEWLLIYDNVEDIELVKRFLPTSRGGALLLTTRIHALGTLAHTIGVTQMSQEEGIYFLSRRAKLLHSTTLDAMLSPVDSDSARTIVELMDGLPLALDQAGSYIEVSKCGISDYLQLFQSSQLRLLDERYTYADHPASVSRTFALAFEQLKQNNPIAAELLAACTFLHPDAIPEEVFTSGLFVLVPEFQPMVGDPYAFNEALAMLCQYSLLRRDPKTKMLTIHRLVQIVLRNSMNENEQREWAEQVVRAVNHVFPNRCFTFALSRCHRYLPHMYICASLIEQWNIVSVDAGRLLNEIGNYLRERAEYTQGEAYFLRALKIRTQIFVFEHPDVANSLNDLGLLYYYQGKYAQAESLYQQAFTIREKTLGLEHPDVAEVLNNLASLCTLKGEYLQAESLHLKALSIREKVLDVGHTDIAESLSNLGTLYSKQGKYTQSETFQQRALEIYERTLGSQHSEVAICLNNLAYLYSLQDRYIQAEPLYQRALTIYKGTLGMEHPLFATSLYNLALLYAAQDKCVQAEQFYQQALAIREKVLVPEHPNIAYCLYGLAKLYSKQGKYDQAEHLYQRALMIQEKVLEAEHLDIARTLESYAMLLEVTRKETEAAVMRERAKGIRNKHASLSSLS